MVSPLRLLAEPLESVEDWAPCPHPARATAEANAVARMTVFFIGFFLLGGRCANRSGQAEQSRRDRLRECDRERQVHDGHEDHGIDGRENPGPAPLVPEVEQGED